MNVVAEIVIFGPWANGIPPAERVARLRSLRALALVCCAGNPEFTDALAAAETDADALGRAYRLLDYLPAPNKRKLLASYGLLTGGRS
jgi:hypothetical protein